MMLRLILGLCLVVSGCLAAPTYEPTTVEVCDSCNAFVDFAQKLTANDDVYDAVKYNLTTWCIDSGHGVNRHFCSSYVNNFLNSIERIPASSFCERIKACEQQSSVELPPINTDNTTCDFCVNVMNHVRAIVTAPETEAELKLVIAKACTYTKDFQDECVSLVDENLDNVFLYLKKMMDPRGVCQQSGYCTFRQDDSAFSNIDIVGVINIGPVVAPYVRPLAVPADVAGVLSRPVQTGDDDEEIIPFLTIERTASGITLSPEEIAAEPVVEEEAVIRIAIVTPVASSMNCVICKEVATWVIHKLKDNKTEPAIVKALDEVCDKILPKAKQSQCEAFVEQYADELIGILKQESNPDLICVLLGECEVTEKTANPPQSNNLDCVVCKQIANWVVDKLQDNKTDDAIKQALDQVCERVIPKMKSQCEQFVEKYAEQMITIIREEDDPNLICDLIGACRSSNREETLHPTSHYPLCGYCTKAAQWIGAHVPDNRTEDQIISCLDKVCEALFPEKCPARARCENEVNEKVPQIVACLQTIKDPGVWCSDLKMCPPTVVVEEEELTTDVAITDVETEAVDEDNEIDNNNDNDQQPSPVVTKPRSDEACFECQAVAHFIQTELYDYNKEKEIDDYVIKTVCDKALNVIAKETCESFVNEYGSSILQLFAMRAFDPKVLCEDELKICPKTNSTIAVGQATTSTPDFELRRPSTAEWCNMCMTSVGTLEQMLANQELDHEISTLVSRACTYADAKKQAQCVVVIETYGPYFLQMLGRVDSRHLCKSVDLCVIPNQVHLLGGHKCTFGPSYWCHTTAHAEACKATTFCQRKVWQQVQ